MESLCVELWTLLLELFVGCRVWQQQTAREATDAELSGGAQVTDGCGCGQSLDAVVDVAVGVDVRV